MLHETAPQARVRFIARLRSRKWRRSYMAMHQELQAYKSYLWLSALSALGQNIVWTVSGVYQVEVVKLNPLQLVLIGTVLESTVFLLQAPTGALADLYSRRLSMLIGNVPLVCSYLIQGIWPHFPV